MSALPALAEAPARGGRVFHEGFALAEELGLAGVTVTSIGGRTAGVQ